MKKVCARCLVRGVAVVYVAAWFQAVKKVRTCTADTLTVCSCAAGLPRCDTQHAGLAVSTLVRAWDERQHAGDGMHQDFRAGELVYTILHGGRQAGAVDEP